MKQWQRRSVIAVLVTSLFAGVPFVSDGQQRPQQRRRVVPGTVHAARPILGQMARDYIGAKTRKDKRFAEILQGRRDDVRARGHHLSDDQAVIVRVNFQYETTAPSGLVALWQRLMPSRAHAQTVGVDGGEMILWPYYSDDTTTQMVSYTNSYETGVGVWLDGQIDISTQDAEVYWADVSLPEDCCGMAHHSPVEAGTGTVAVLHAEEGTWRGVSCKNREALIEEWKKVGKEAAIAGISGTLGAIVGGGCSALQGWWLAACYASWGAATASIYVIAQAGDFYWSCRRDRFQ